MRSRARNGLRARNQGRTRHFELATSDDESMVDGSSSEEEKVGGRRLRAARGSRNDAANRPLRNSGGRGPDRNEPTRPRRQAAAHPLSGPITVVPDHEEEASKLTSEPEYEASAATLTFGIGGLHGDASQKHEDAKLEARITSCDFQDSAREDSFSQRGSKGKRGAVIGKEGRFSACKESSQDHSYKLVPANAQPGPHRCHFCQRQIVTESQVGPFLLDQPSSRPSSSHLLESQESAPASSQPLYFHKECLETNSYVRYDARREIYANLKVALKHLVENKSYTCYGCLSKGATVQCSQCDRAFHGYHCSRLYLLALDEQSSGYQCLFCKNTQNSDMHLADSRLLKRTNARLPELRKALDRSHLTEVVPFSASNFFMPQLGDQVVYFFQAHEEFHHGNNLFFYSGVNRVVSSKDLPWMRHQQLKNAPTGQALCEVL